MEILKLDLRYCNALANICTLQEVFKNIIHGLKRCVKNVFPFLKKVNIYDIQHSSYGNNFYLIL
ncbi:MULTISPECIES: hypothetical protein [Clostridium]|uniref:hypothetical protein n=1 Tax=Clostridium TaxID=1485 RepID=UPI0002884F83|nr:MULTISPECIES: hypothetical protein [Clostridium]